MRLDPALALVPLIALSASACDVHVEVDGHDARRGPHAAADSLPEPEPETEVWFRDFDVVVVDEPLALDFELRLRPDRTFLFVAEIDDGDGVERTTVEGRYRWEADRLTLMDDGGDAQVFTRRGEELELETDWPGDVVLAVTRLPDPALRRAR